METCRACMAQNDRNKMIYMFEGTICEIFSKCVHLEVSNIKYDFQRTNNTTLQLFMFRLAIWTDSHRTFALNAMSYWLNIINFELNVSLLINNQFDSDNSRIQHLLKISAGSESDVHFRHKVIIFIIISISFSITYFVL